MKVLLVTGGAGFIGSNFINYFIRRNKNYIIVNIDKLTYSGSTDNLMDVEASPRYHFVKGDICNQELISYIFKRYKPNCIINFAAESNVDRNMMHPAISAETNITGTLTLLECARNIWIKNKFYGNCFIQISTDEVYGSLGNSEDYSLEESILRPESLYSASKASADMIAMTFFKTYGMPVVITRCCNNYGPHQHIEKLIPTCIKNAFNDQPIPIYGDGSNVREWIHVLDHCIAIIRTIFYGKPGEIYNIGSGEEISNLEIAKKVLRLLNKPEDQIQLISDRPAQDKRYALNCYKIRNNLNWSSKYQLDDGLKETIRWYKENMNLEEN